MESRAGNMNMNPMNNKILIITYVFPPVGGAGVQRGVKFVKYLSRLGWKPFVLTVKNPSAPLTDHSLEKDIPADATVHRALTLEPPYRLKQLMYKNIARSGEPKPGARNGLLTRMMGWIKKLIKSMVEILFTPDPNIGWVPLAYWKARRIIKKENIRYVFITAPPFSSFIIGYWLKKKYDIRLILDYRDEWSPFYIKNYDFIRKPSYLQKWIISLEKKIIQAADLVTMASPYFVENYRNHYQQEAKEKFVDITNGFDPDDVPEELAKIKHSKSREKLVFTYAGTVFKLTDLSYILKNFDQFVMNNNLQDKVLFRIVGRVTVDQEEYLGRYRQKPYISITEYMPHVDVVREMASADVLVLTLSPLEGCERIIPGKIFEYLMVRNPIFAIVPEGIAATLVRETAAGVVVDPEDDQRIQRELKNLYEKWEKGLLMFEGKEEKIRQFSREELTRKLLYHLERLDS